MNNLIANERAYQTLVAGLRGGRLSHALLIEGPAGCGKSTFAREIAQAALCAAPGKDGPCGICRDCVKIAKDIHPDVLSYRGQGGSRSFHIDTVRALRRDAYVRPNEAEGKVIIIQNAQEMSVGAQNALLKIIEEPPAQVSFVLTCDNRFSLLETIRSRVQIIPLQLPSEEECAALLQSLRPDAPDNQLERAATLARGNVGRALALLDGEDAPDDAAIGILCDACIGDELAALAALAKYERDRPGLTALLSQMKAALAEAIVRPPADARLLRLTGRAGRLQLIEILAIIEDTLEALPQNVGGLLLVTGMSAKMRAALADDES